MKLTAHNIARLRKLGFKPDNETGISWGSPDWWSLSCGWGFEIDSIKNFRQLKSRLRISAEEEEMRWTRQMRRAYKMLDVK